MNQPFILDCSVTMTWFFEGEATLATDLLLDQLSHGGEVLVPSHWALEVANTLLMGERRKRATTAESIQFQDILRGLAIKMDVETAARAGSDALALARSHHLTVYDAAYLELAMRRNLPLATLDQDLRSAAKKAGVKCLPEKI